MTTTTTEGTASYKGLRKEPKVGNSYIYTANPGENCEQYLLIARYSHDLLLFINEIEIWGY